MERIKPLKIIDRGINEIQFDFNPAFLSTIKSIPGRKFHQNAAGKKYCTCPLSLDAIQCLTKYLQQSVEEIDQIGKLKKTLFPFQKEGVAFIEKRNGRALIGDEMGLGKTIQALGWLHLHPKRKPVIIVCPAHLKLNWAKEIEVTLPGKQNVQVLYGKKPSSCITGDILIINYDILANTYEEYRDSAGRKRFREIKRTGWVDYLIDLKPSILIIDEAHYCKSTTSFRTKGTRKLAKKCPYVLALTGTPITNRPIEGFYIIQLIDRNIFPNFMTYVRTYCDAKHNGFGWDYSGASNQKQLYQKLQEVMIRRKKVDVLKDLPDKTYSYVPMEITNAEEYNAAEANFIRYLRHQKGTIAANKAQAAEHLVKIEALKQLAVKGKMKQTIQWIQEFLNSGAGKLVLFTVHKNVIDTIIDKFKDCAVRYDGSVSSIKREENKNAFQNNPKIKLFIGNIQAAGTGLTLTAASSVVFLELPWSPGELVQAEDRCHRIGQKNAVTIYFLLAQNTIETKIASLLDKKRKVLTAILDGEKVEKTRLLSELMKEYEDY